MHNVLGEVSVMAKRNYFELLGLDFDPPEKNQRRIEKAINEWKRRTEDMLANETVESYRQSLNEELSLFEDIVSVMNDVKLRNIEARALRQLKVRQLEQILDILMFGSGNSPIVTTAQIRSVCSKLKLSPKTVEEIYTSKGFSISKPAAQLNLDDYFLSSVIYGHLSTNLKRLKTLNSTKYPWTSKINDMYDLACFFGGGSERDRVGFRRRRAGDLYAIMETWASRLASDMSEEGHLLGDLFTAGMTQVFDCEANREKYDSSLKRDQLKELFSLIKAAPEEFKRDRYFAEGCIEKIRRSFPEYNLALALYNREGGLLKDPYEPFDASIHIICPSCEAPYEFRDTETAQRSVCTVCGSKLYVKCPKCSKPVPAAAKRCLCGFNVREMQYFDEYVNQSRTALLSNDLDSAQRYYNMAELSYPGNPELSSLKNELDAQKDKYQRPINELHALINAKRFCAAKEHADKLSASMPNLNIEKEKKLIESRLNQAQQMMPTAQLPFEQRANACIDVLDIVADHYSATQILSTIPVLPPVSLNAAAGGEKDIFCNLSWLPSGDRAVTYRIVRKKNTPPTSITDGKVIASQISETEFCDKTIVSGINYGYAVFAHRANVFSKPAVCSAAVFSDLDRRELSAAAGNNSCKFSWVLPENSIGVRVIRKEGTIPPVVPDSSSVIASPKAFALFNDGNLRNNVTYGYRLQCVYPCDSGFAYSEGITLMLTPEYPPEVLQNVTAGTSGNNVTISWKKPLNVKTTVIIKEITDSAYSLTDHNVMDISDITEAVGGGNIFANVAGIDGEVSFVIGENTQHTLAVLSLSGSKGIVSEVVRVSSVSKCEIDRKNTEIVAGRLCIRLAKIPDMLERIHYCFAVKTEDTVPWASVNDIRNGTMQSVFVDEYLRDGMMMIEKLPEKELYVTVIGEYRMDDGSAVYSEPSKIRINNKPKQLLSYKFSWMGTGLLNRIMEKSCRLTITSNGKDLPTVYVVCRTDGHIPMNLDDPKTKIIHQIEEKENAFVNGEFVYRLPDDAVKSMNVGMYIRCFTSADYKDEFDLSPSDVASCVVK